MKNSSKLIVPMLMMLSQFAHASSSPDRIVVTVDMDHTIVRNASRAEVSKAVSSSMPQIESCYENQLKTNATSVGGDVTAQFTFSPSGRVTLISTEGSVPYPEVKSCIASAFRRTQFPKSNDFGTASYRILFTLEHHEVKTLSPSAANATGPAKIQSSAPTTPGISREVSAKIIGAKLFEINTCYQSQLKVNPNLRGSVSVKFVIETSGDVSSAVTSSTTLHDAPTENCINEIFRHMKFPPPPGRDYVEITYPMMFRPDSKDAYDDEVKKRLEKAAPPAPKP